MDASGGTGGGTILIGGDVLGQGDVQNARAAFLGYDVTVTADSIVQGDGGKIVVFAEESAKIGASLSARGGAQGGNGGFIKERPVDNLVLDTVPDLRAPNGDGGEWLIDPRDVTISANPHSRYEQPSPFTPNLPALTSTWRTWWPRCRAAQT